MDESDNFLLHFTSLILDWVIMKRDMTGAEVPAESAREKTQPPAT
jgi:hypothetical protein